MILWERPHRNRGLKHVCKHASLCWPRYWIMSLGALACTIKGPPIERVISFKLSEVRRSRHAWSMAARRSILFVCHCRMSQMVCVIISLVHIYESCSVGESLSIITTKLRHKSFPLLEFCVSKQGVSAQN